MCFGLDAPEKEEVISRKIEKVFDYEEDMEELGKSLDKKNRSTFSKEECDSLFIASTDVLNDLNLLDNNDKKKIDEHLKIIKKEALEKEILFSSEEFDIFGGITQDKTKISVLGNTKHRELEKNKFKILEINKNTKKDEYISTLENINDQLQKVTQKAKFGTNLNAFYASTESIKEQKYAILYINPQNAIDMLKNENRINLYNIKLKEDTKAIALTNIMYYDNSNRTLPVGMNVSDKIFVDMSKLKLEPKKQKLFRINQEIDELKVLTKIICVYEYEVMEE